MDIYVLVDPQAVNAERMVVSVHGRLQGAELARSEYAHRVADANWPDDYDAERRFYDRLIIVNRDLRDVDE